MWTYGPPYPDVLIEEIEQPDFIEHETYSWRFELGAQTGTYLETSLHVRRDGPQLIEVPVEELVMRDAAVLRVPCEADQKIEEADLAGCGVGEPGDAVIVATGWTAMERPTSTNCFGSADAMLDHRPQPIMMCGDVPPTVGTRRAWRVLRPGTLLAPREPRGDRGRPGGDRWWWAALSLG